MSTFALRHFPLLSESVCQVRCLDIRLGGSESERNLATTETQQLFGCRQTPKLLGNWPELCFASRQLRAACREIQASFPMIFSMLLLLLSLLLLCSNYCWRKRSRIIKGISLNCVTPLLRFRAIIRNSASSLLTVSQHLSCQDQSVAPAGVESIIHSMSPSARQVALQAGNLCSKRERTQTRLPNCSLFKTIHLSHAKFTELRKHHFWKQPQIFKIGKTWDYSSTRKH